MTLFETLFLAHLLGDWLFQTEWMALNKAKNWRALLTHVTVYHAIVLGALGLRIGVDARGLVVVAALFLSHAIMDRREPVVGLMRALRMIANRPPEFWLLMAVDQSLHLLALGAAVFVLTL